MSFVVQGSDFKADAQKESMREEHPQLETSTPKLAHGRCLPVTPGGKRPENRGAESTIPATVNDYNHGGWFDYGTKKLQCRAASAQLNHSAGGRSRLAGDPCSAPCHDNCRLQAVPTKRLNYHPQLRTCAIPQLSERMIEQWYITIYKL